MAHTYSFQKSGSLHSPALIYYRDIIASNIQKAINAAQVAEHLWPHIKSHKMADVIRMSMTFGITHFKCATISEAETAASCHTPHIMLAYPLVGPNISRFIQLAEAFPQTHFYAIGDNLEMLSYLGKEASTSATLKNIDVLVDGTFNKELHDPTLKWRGSSNQRVIDVQKSLKEKETVLL